MAHSKSTIIAIIPLSIIVLIFLNGCITSPPNAPPLCGDGVCELDEVCELDCESSPEGETIEQLQLNKVENTPSGSAWSVESVSCGAQTCEFVLSGTPPESMVFKIAEQDYAVVTAEDCTASSESISVCASDDVSNCQDVSNSIFSCSVELVADQSSAPVGNVVLPAGVSAGSPVNISISGSDGVKASAVMDVSQQLSLNANANTVAAAASSSEPLFEFGSVNTACDGTSWKKVDLKNVYTQPVVIAEPLTFNGPAPAHVRIRNVTRTSFEVRIEEWMYQGNRTHGNEVIQFFVMNAGRYVVDGKNISAFYDANVDHNFKTINGALITKSIVFAQPQTYHGWAAIVTRVKNILPPFFDVKVQEEEGQDGYHAKETVGVIAIEEGNYPGFSASRVSGVMGAFQAVELVHNKPNTAIFVAAMQTANGTDSAGLRVRHIVKDSDSISFEIKVEEEQSKDAEMNHAAETVGLLVNFGEVLGYCGDGVCAEDEIGLCEDCGSAKSGLPAINSFTQSGGDVWELGENIRVSWNSDFSSPVDYSRIVLVNATDNTYYYDFCQNTSASGNCSWTVSSILNGEGIGAGTYYLTISILGDEVYRTRNTNEFEIAEIPANEVCQFKKNVVGDEGNIDPDPIPLAVGDTLNVLGYAQAYGYVIQSFTVGGDMVPNSQNRRSADTNVTCTSPKDITARISFKELECTFSASVVGEGGTVSPSSGVLAVGEDQSITITPNESEGYSIADVKVNGDSKGPVDGVRIECNPRHSRDVTDFTVQATFVKDKCELTSTAGPHGTVDPMGNVDVPVGDFFSIAARAEQGFVIDKFLVTQIMEEGGDAETEDRATGFTSNLETLTARVRCIQGGINSYVTFKPVDSCSDTEFKDTLANLDAWSPAQINKPSFEEWVSEYEEEVRNAMTGFQCRPDNWMEPSSAVTMQNIIAGLDTNLRVNRPALLGINLYDNVEKDGYHAVIATGVEKYDDPNSDFDSYRIRIIDPNKGASVIDCESHFEPNEHYYRCFADAYSNQGTDEVIVDGLTSPGDDAINSRIRNAQAVRDDPLAWLNQHYTKFRNFSTEESRGTCKGWAEFNARASLFVKECPWNGADEPLPVPKVTVDDPIVPQPKLTVAYSHPFGRNGRLNLWSGAEAHVYNPNTRAWSYFEPEDKLAQGLYSGFSPVVGYYDSFGDNGGRITLWNSVGAARVYQPQANVWVSYKEEDKIKDGLGASFKPVVGYYLPSPNGGEVQVWDATGTVFSYNNSAKKWVDVTLSQAGLPKGFVPVKGYAFRHSDGKNGRIHLWDKNGKVFAYTTERGKWGDWTNIFPKRGLPAGKTPDVGYQDPYKNKVILVYGEDTYESSDGFTNFTKSN